MKTYEFAAGSVMLNGSPSPLPVRVLIPEYQDRGLVHGGTWNARGAEARMGKERADALVRVLRRRRRSAR